MLTRPAIGFAASLPDRAQALAPRHAIDAEACVGTRAPRGGQCRDARPQSVYGRTRRSPSNSFRVPPRRNASHSLLAPLRAFTSILHQGLRARRSARWLEWRRKARRRQRWSAGEVRRCIWVLAGDWCTQSADRRRAAQRELRDLTCAHVPVSTMSAGRANQESWLWATPSGCARP